MFISCGVPFSKSPGYPIEGDDDKTIIIDDDVISERGMKEEVIEEIEEETRQIHMDVSRNLSVIPINTSSPEIVIFSDDTQKVCGR